MKKIDVYELIGYHGEYNASVKKAIRKLLKENHPDNKGDRKVFELINEVKKELESGKTGYLKKETQKESRDFDYDYCYRMINDLKIKKNSFSKLMDSKKEVLNKCENEYKDLYQKKLDVEHELLIPSPYVKKVQDLKLLSVVFLILIIITLIVAILTSNNLFFVVVIILAIICVLVGRKHLVVAQKMTENNKRRFTSYIKIDNEIRKNIKKQNGIKKEIREIKRKITNIENDLRFYKNLLK